MEVGTTEAKVSEKEMKVDSGGRKICCDRYVGKCGGSYDY